MKTKITFLLIISYLSIGSFTPEQPISVNASISGEVQMQDLKSYKWFRKGFRKYKPNSKFLDSLKQFSDYSILIYGGDWCSDTYAQLPRMMKVLKMLKFPENQIKIIFVDDQKKCDNCKDYSPEKYKINLVPAFIVFNKEKKEIGRIIETPKETLESDLLHILMLNN